MAKATAHPDRRLISSEDVQGTEVYGAGDQAIGEIDHLLIEKVSGRVPLFCRRLSEQNRVASRLAEPDGLPAAGLCHLARSISPRSFQPRT